MSIRFRYTKFPPNIYFPVVDLVVIHPRKNIPSPQYKAIIDSGASGCIFHASIGEFIGLNVKSGKKLPLKGVTEGAGEQYLHQVILDVEGQLSILAEVGFSYDLHYPFGLLGEREFFEVLKICFDLSRKEFEITPKHRRQERFTSH